MIQELIFGLAGGLALFLYGVLLISNGFQKALGQKAAKALEKVTDHPIKGIAVGAITTTVFQSSSLTMVTLIGLVNSGLLNLGQAVGVMLGAEIGTTITAQIIAFKISHFALPIIALGFFVRMVSRNEYVKYASQAIMGFGILFLGMGFMKAGVQPLSGMPFFEDMMTNFSNIPILALLAAALFTAIIQSSSATIGIVIVMASEGLLTLGAAIPLILGANIGTTITGVLASINSSKTAKRLALAHVFFNVIGVIVAMFLLKSFTSLASSTSSDLPRQIANAHTIFNVLGAIVGLFLIKKLVSLVKKVIRGKETRPQNGAKHLDEFMLKSPATALMQSKKEIYEMAKVAESMIADLRDLYKNYEVDKFKEIVSKEDNTDVLYKAINQYLAQLTGSSLSQHDSEKLTTQMHVISDIERVGDHAKNLAYIKRNINRKNGDLSKEAYRDIDGMLNLLQEIFNASTEVIETEDTEALDKIKEIEQKIDDMEKELQKKHLCSVESGNCDPAFNVLYISILRNIERAGDHSNNIAHEILIYNHVADLEID